jgi:hypothetical protein
MAFTRHWQYRRGRRHVHELKPGNHAVQIRRVSARTRVRRRVDERIERIALFGDAQSDISGAAFDERALALVRNVRATVLGDRILRTGREKFTEDVRA